MPVLKALPKWRFAYFRQEMLEPRRCEKRKRLESLDFDQWSQRLSSKEFSSQGLACYPFSLGSKETCSMHSQRAC
jgi:hypothetical protein